jgi:hypothetical protein
METLFVQKPSQSKIMVQREDNQERVTVKYIQCGSCAKRWGKLLLIEFFKKINMHKKYEKYLRPAKSKLVVSY